MERSVPVLIKTSRDSVLVLTLNRPERRNALSAEMKAGIVATLEGEAAAPRHRALLLKGAGGAFCSGADARPDDLLARRDRIADEIRSGVNRIVTLLAALPYPVVAAVQGPAAGAGIGLALAADVLLVAPSARLHVNFCRIGAVPDAGTIYQLTHRLGTARAAALAMLGGVIGAKEALDWGLAAAGVTDENFDADAHRAAANLAAGPTRALGLTKKLLASARESALKPHLEFEAVCQAEAFVAADFEEGVRARAEKRVPRFTGG